MDGQQSMDIDATVDTGAAYTTIPARLLRQLGIEPMGQRQFMLSDGQRVWMDYGQARATVEDESVTTIVVFSDDDAPLSWAPTPWRVWRWRWTRFTSGWFPPT